MYIIGIEINYNKLYLRRNKLMLIKTKSREDWDMIKDEYTFKSIECTPFGIMITYNNKSNTLLWLHEVLGEENLSGGYIIGTIIMSAYVMSYCHDIIENHIQVTCTDRYEWVNEAFKNAPIVNNGTVVQALSANGPYIIPTGRYSGSGKIPQVPQTRHGYH